MFESCRRQKIKNQSQNDRFRRQQLQDFEHDDENIV